MKAMDTLGTRGWKGGVTLAARAGLVLLAFASLAPSVSRAQWFDLAPFARRCRASDDYTAPTTFDYTLGHAGSPQFERVADRYICALQWAEERDVQEVRLRFVSTCAGLRMRLEYWFANWPYPPPTMPTIEDPVDDPWQGRWLNAATEAETSGRECRLTFLPLKTGENPKADNLPGLRYRRTLKLRLVCDEPPPAVQTLEVFSGSTQTKVALRIELGVKSAVPTVWEGQLTAYNGAVENLRKRLPATKWPARPFASAQLVDLRAKAWCLTSRARARRRAGPTTSPFSRSGLGNAPFPLPCPMRRRDRSICPTSILT